MTWFRRAVSHLLAPIALGAAIVSWASAAPAKRLIEMGWDEPDPAFMRRHLAQLEATPFDGCVYHLFYDAGPGRPPGRFTWEAWGKRTFTAAEVESGLRDLIATPFRRFRWNFLRLNVTPGVDWFDDFGAVVSNARLAAEVAKGGGSAGVMLDTEPYESEIFRYDSQRGTGTHSFDEYADQARRRGAEVMRAFEQGYPGLTVFLTVGPSCPYLQAVGGVRRETGRYGLLMPFVDGMVSAASDSARIVDGNELAYPVGDPAELDEFFRAMTDGVSAWFTDSTRYRHIISRSFGLWLDYESAHLGWNVQKPKQNPRTPDSMRALVRRALVLADDYVWIYSQKPRWWTEAGSRKDLPDAYIQALRAARKGIAP